MLLLRPPGSPTCLSVTHRTPDPYSLQLGFLDVYKGSGFLWLRWTPGWRLRFHQLNCQCLTVARHSGAMISWTYLAWAEFCDLGEALTSLALGPSVSKIRGKIVFSCYNSIIEIKFTHHKIYPFKKYTVQCFLVYSQSYAKITTI